MSVTLTTIKNPFDPGTNVIEVKPFKKGACLDHYLAGINHPPDLKKGINFVISVNGVLAADDNVQVCDGDKIAVVAMVEATAVAAAASWFASVVVGGSAAFSTAIAYSVAYGAAYLAATFAMGYGFSALASALSPDVPDSVRNYSDTAVNQTYGWGELSQTITEGGRIPIGFGTNKMAGQVINQFVTIDGNKETLNVLLGLFDHAVDSISDVQVNDQPYTYFRDIEVIADRLGTVSDTVIEGFNDIISQVNVGSKLNLSSAVTQDTGGTAVEKLILFITAPNGLYYSNDAGGLSTRSAIFTVEYQVKDAPSWTSHPDSPFTLSGATTETQRQVIEIDSLTADQYTVRITRTNAAESSFRGNSDIYFSVLQEVVKEELSYPGLSKYAIKALATDQLSGTLPRFSCMSTRATVTVFDYELATPAWANKRATNPAWICYSLLVDYAGIDKDRLIWDDWNTWADYCDESVDSEYRFIVNTIIGSGNFWNQVQRVARLGRGSIIRRGTRYGVFVDNAQTTVSHLFTMGNIIAETFKLQYLPKKDRANAVEVEYTDIDRDYTRQVICVYSDDYLADETDGQKAQVKIDAAISQAEAVREGVFRINSNKYLSRVVTFDADVDSFACTVGDLFYFAHETVDYETSRKGSRILAAGNDDGSGNPFVQLDQDVTIENGVTYKILVRLSDDTLVEKTVGNAAGTTDTLTLTTTFSTVPATYDLFLFGVASTYKKTYRLTGITRADDFTRTITGIEYIPEIYTDNDDYVIEEPTWETRKQEAVQVMIHEFLSYGKDGKYNSNINISWQRNYTQTGANWTIWIENTSAATDPIKAGDCFENSFVINSGLVVGNSYKIYVSAFGEGAIDTGGNTATITIQGKLAPPADVLGFSGSWDPIHRQVDFSWTVNSELDISHYVIKEGSTWAGGTIVLEPRANFGSIYIDEGVAETRTYRIKAVDTSGVYSDTEATAAVAIDTSDCGLSIPGALALSSSSVIVRDGKDVVTLLSTWNADAESSDNFHHYDLLLEDTDTGKVSQFATSSREFRWEVMPNREYGVSVRAVDVSGNHTDWSTQVTHTTTKDALAPATPTWPATGYAIAGFKVIGLSWDDNTEYDLSHYVLERSTSPTFASDITVLGNILASFHSDASDLDVLTPYYYRIKAVDTSGNASGYSAIKSTTTLQVGQTDIAAGSIIADHISVANLAAINANLGTITSGRIQSADNMTFFDLNNDLMALGSKLTWDGVNLAIEGSITVTSATGYDQFTDKPTSLADINAGEYSVLQNSIETWFYDGVPTLANVPASTWTTDSLKTQHLGDLYYDNLTGYAYRFRLVVTTYSWLKLTDSDVTQALAAAATAQDTADGKRRVFLPGSNPAPPYDAGDLWDTGAAAGIKRCQTAKAQGGAYAAEDWVAAADQTSDNTAADTVLVNGVSASTVQENAQAAYDSVSDMEDDGKLSPAEKKIFERQWPATLADYQSLTAYAASLSVDTSSITDSYTDYYNYLVAAGVWSDPDNTYTLTDQDDFEWDTGIEWDTGLEWSYESLTDKAVSYAIDYELLVQACNDQVAATLEAAAQAEAQSRAAAAERAAKQHTQDWSQYGATDDSDLRHASDVTKIDGGKIHAGSIIQIGNTVDGDYCHIDSGDIDFFYRVNSQHVNYKSLKRREEGIGEHDDLITIPGYFKNSPKVDVIPKSTQTYSTSLATYNVNQVLQCQAEDIEEFETSRWRFTIKCLLIASSAGTFSQSMADLSGSDTRALYWNHQTLVKTLTSSTITTPAATTQVIATGNSLLSTNSLPIHGLTIQVDIVIDGTATQVAHQTWYSPYNYNPKTITANWSNVVTDVTSGTYDVYYKIYFYARAWENNITTSQSATNLNVASTFVPDGEVAAGDVKWIATGE